MEYVFDLWHFLAKWDVIDGKKLSFKFSEDVVRFKYLSFQINFRNSGYFFSLFFLQQSLLNLT